MKKLIIFSCLFLITSMVKSQQDDAGEINKILTNWVESFNSSDYQKSISIYDRDFIGYYPNQADQKLKDLEEQYRHIFNNKNLSVKLEMDIFEISVSGNLGFVRMTLKATIKSTFSSQPGIAYDKGIQVWKKTDGNWKLFRSSSFPLPEPK